MLVGCRKVSARDRREDHRQASRREDAALHGLNLFWDVSMAVVIATSRIGDPDYRFFQARRKSPLLLRKSGEGKAKNPCRHSW